MNTLLVHGMGRSSLAWLPTVRRLRKHGIVTTVFNYSVALQDFSSIVARLVKDITALAAHGDYVVVGHSLGGVLLRAALNNLPANTPLPQQVFLLGSPILPSRIAMRLHQNPLFNAVTSDCGKLLASHERMSEILAAPVHTVAIIGTRGMQGRFTPFGDEPNDGIVAVSEVSADWFAETIHVPVVHTLLPSSERVSAIILERIV